MTGIRVYVSRSLPKNAVLWWGPGTYELEWGTQVFDGPHMVVRNADYDYGVDLGVFFSTHKPILDKKDHYLKVVVIRAMQAKDQLQIVTRVEGELESVAKVPAGAWIIQNPRGEIYFNSPEEFELRYRPLAEVRAAK